LVRAEVLKTTLFLRSDFNTLEAAGLEWGHRLLAEGIQMRHVPTLVDAQAEGNRGAREGSVSFREELRFIGYRYGRKWRSWAWFRAVATGYVTVWRGLMACGALMSTSGRHDRATSAVSETAGRKQQRAQSIDAPRGADDPAKGRPEASSLPPALGKSPSLRPDQRARSHAFMESDSIGTISAFRVSVLIPTVDRYPYLRVLLNQLRFQTVPPCDIVVIDQTSCEGRDRSLSRDFSDLPLRIIYQDEAGQCASRNAGLETVTGDCVLFIDDDDEVEPDLIERHLSVLKRFSADSSSGVAAEVGAENFTPSAGVIRSSDQFPTNNTLAKLATFEKAGLFDLAYNRGQRADGDLGMRVYLSGATMVLSTDISVLHHHAPSGGLRKHNARVVTYASSRSRLFHRNLPSATEFYLGYRYFGRHQVREMAWLRVLGTFSAKGGLLRIAGKLLLGFILLPHTLWVVRQRWKQGENMLMSFPSIPKLKKARDTGS
jgi:glycosyltransferase involved in cell wall biosynthesis